MLAALLLAVTLPVAPVNRIADSADLLTPDEVSSLGVLIAHEESIHGVKFGLLTLSNLDDDPKAVAVRVINFWGLGTRSAVLLVSTNPRKIYIQPGDALASALNSSRATRIASDVIAPKFKARRLYDGIVAGFNAMDGEIENTAPVFNFDVTKGAPPQIVYTRAAAPIVAPIAPWPWWAWFCIFGFAIVLVWLFIRWLRTDSYVSEPVYRGYPRSVPMQSMGQSVQQTTIVNGGSNMADAVIAEEILSHRQTAPVYSPPVYVPLPSAPAYDPPSLPDPIDSGSSGIGGGGFDWGGSDGGSSGGGGGGSDW